MVPCESLGTVSYSHYIATLDTALGGRPNIAITFGMGKLVWLSDGEKSLRICLAVSREYRRVTDRRTDRRTDRQTNIFDSIDRAMQNIAC